MHEASVPVAEVWKGIAAPPVEHEEDFDEYFIIVDEHTGSAVCNRFYRLTLATGEVIEGYTDDEGRTAYAAADKRVAVNLELAPQTEIQVGD